MFTLEDYRWLTSPSGRRAWEQLQLEKAPASLGSIKKLTAGDESHARLLLEQLRIADRNARRKFSEPHRWFWTQQLFEQSSDEQVAHDTALDFPPQQEVVDGCCGAGADSVALCTQSRPTLSIDLDPVACMLTHANLESHRLTPAVHCGLIESTPLPERFHLHVDPDRRATGNRTIQPEHMAPAWPSLSPIIAKSTSCSLKLAPGLKFPHHLDWGPSGPPSALRWISRQGTVRQQRWYWRVERWPENAIITSCLTRQGNWHHEVFAADNIASHAGSIDPKSNLKNVFIADQDPVLRAANVVSHFALRIDASLLGGDSGYYLADQPQFHPMLTWFKIDDVLPFDRKKLRAYARVRKAKNWELKSRGVEIDLDKTAKELETHHGSEERVTILFTRHGTKHLAIVATRIDEHAH